MLSTYLRGAKIPPVTYLNGFSLVNQTSDASRTITLSSGFVAGDLIVAMTGNRTGTAPALPAGYTSLVVNNNPAGRSLRVQYKIAESTSESISWTGAYGYIIALRNFTEFGVTNTINTSASGTTLTIPSLTGLSTSGRGFILAGSYPQAIYTATTSPYSLFSTFGVRVTQNTDSSITGETLTLSASTSNSLYAIEIL